MRTAPFPGVVGAPGVHVCVQEHRQGDLLTDHVPPPTRRPKPCQPHQLRDVDSFLLRCTPGFRAKRPNSCSSEPIGGCVFLTIMDTALSFVISAGIIAFGVWVIVAAVAADLPLAWTLMGLLPVVVGSLSLIERLGTPRT
jgi:hypothetical protein